MTREERIVRTFVEFAGTLVDDFDVVEFLHRITKRSEELLGCSEAGLLLADATGTLRVMASSSEHSAALDLLQSQHAEGPCFECYNRGEPVHSADLRADAARWPTFAPAAVQRGFLGVQAIPMRAGGEVIGALNLFRHQTGRLAEDDRYFAQGLADVAAVALLHERVIRDARRVIGQLQGALTSRIIIEQAKGALAAGVGIDIDEAFTRLRDHARRSNRRLADVARDLVEGRLDTAVVMRAHSS